MQTPGTDIGNHISSGLEKSRDWEPASASRPFNTSRLSRLWSIFGLLVLLCLAGVWLNQHLLGQFWPTDPETIQMLLACLILAYAICMMLPFMPAIELGLILLTVLDIQGVLGLYLVTILALTASYSIGRFIPVRILKNLFQYLHLHKVSELLCCDGGCSEQEQINRLIEQTPKRLLPFLLRHRYAVVAVALNTPGNMFIGGAGGIALMSGLSRMYGPGRFIITAMIAISPLPILAILSKLMILG